MPDPTDKELLQFVARFVGRFDGLHWTEGGRLLYGVRSSHEWQEVPDYLSSVDAWLADVWPKIESDNLLAREWAFTVSEMLMDGGRPGLSKAINADAHVRCLALYRALDGVLPEEHSDV